jgi:hypothetical protein
MAHVSLWLELDIVSNEELEAMLLGLGCGCAIAMAVRVIVNDWMQR